VAQLLESSRINGHSFHSEPKVAKKKSGRARKGRTIASTQSNLERTVTVLMGAAIPLLSLSLSSLGGSLLAGGQWSLGLVALALCVCVLGVSLDHVAFAVRSITKSPAWASWLLATACDASLVLGELSGVFASEVDVYYLRMGLMFSVTIASQVLNIFAFLAHRPKAK
jgi:cation transport ATPase